MHFSSVLKRVGLAVLILLILVTAIYQRRPTANLMNLFGLYLLIGVLFFQGDAARDWRHDNDRDG
jgi:hypothetical protein